MDMPGRTAIAIAIACLSSLSSGLVIGGSTVPTEGQDLCWEFLKFYDASQISCSPVDNSLWHFFLVTSFCLSAFISSLLGGVIISRFGRISTLLFNNIFFFVGGILACFAASPAMFCIGRMFSGVGCGLAFVTVPIYIAEISPYRSNGLLTTFHQVSVALGVLISSLLSIYGSAPPVWRFTYGLIIIPAILQSILLVLLGVETPGHLISINKFAKAEEALRILRNTEFVGPEFSELEKLQRMPIEAEEKIQEPAKNQSESTPVEVAKSSPKPRQRPRPLIIAGSGPPVITIAETMAATATATTTITTGTTTAEAEAKAAMTSASAEAEAIIPSTAPGSGVSKESPKHNASAEEGSSKHQISAEKESNKSNKTEGSSSLSSSSSSSAAVVTVKSLPASEQIDEKTEVEEASNSLTSASDPSTSNPSTSYPITPEPSSIQPSTPQSCTSRPCTSNAPLILVQPPQTVSTPANAADMESGSREQVQYYQIMSFRSIFMNGEKLRNRAITMIYINVSQQFFGISAVVFFYPTRILSFYDMGASTDYAVGITVCYFYSIILAIFLFDRVSNYRNLMIASGLGVFIFALCFAIGSATNSPDLSLIAVYFYIISFNIGVCMVSNVILGRGIPTYAIASTSSISNSLAWLVQILIAQCFPLLLSSIQGYVFLIFGFFTVGLGPFIYYVFMKGLE